MIIPKRLAGTPTQKLLQELQADATSVGLVLQRRWRPTLYGGQTLYVLQSRFPILDRCVLGGVTCEASRDGFRLTWKIDGAEGKTRRSESYGILVELFAEIAMFDMELRRIRADYERYKQTVLGEEAANKPKEQREPVKNEPVKKGRARNNKGQWNRWRKWEDGRTTHRSIQQHSLLRGLVTSHHYERADSPSGRLARLPKALRRLEKQEIARRQAIS